MTLRLNAVTKHVQPQCYLVCEKVSLCHSKGESSDESRTGIRPPPAELRRDAAWRFRSWYLREMPRPVCPPVAADVIIEVGDQIVFIERKHNPLGWAFPGGFVEYGETVEQAAVREMREETELEVELCTLLGVYSRPDRDPRGQTITVVYVGRASGLPKGGDDAQAARLFPPTAPPSPLVFDHVEILADYLRFHTTGRLPTPWQR